MPYGNHDIAFTLGRVQPPHQAHFNMLFAALSSLKKNGRLIQFIGSTNVPLLLAQNEKNMLSFEERAMMVTEGLTAELHDRYEKDPMSIPPKFSARIQHGMPVLEPEDFVCIALPDFSDPHGHLSDHDQEAYAQAAAQVVEADLPDNNVFLNIMGKIISNTPSMRRLSIPLYSPSYLAWALNLRTLLNEAIEQYRTTRTPYPLVRFQCCGKDVGTLSYILLITTVAQFFENHYSFDLGFTPIEMLDPHTAVNATDIRNAYVEIVTECTAENIQQFIQHPETLAQRFPVLAHMRPQARVAMIKLLLAR